MKYIKKFLEVLFKWKFKPVSEKKYREADAIVTQAYSVLKNGKPGPGNELIAKTAKALSQMYRLPVLTQSEIELADDSLLYVYIYRGQTGGHSTMACNTYTITEAQASFCKKRGWKKIIVVAFPLHMGRAIWTYQLFGLETMPANMPKTGYAHSELIHWSHRKEWLFFLREILVRVFFFLQKKI